jgi:hypothetical protein
MKIEKDTVRKNEDEPKLAIEYDPDWLRVREARGGHEA